MVRTSNWRRICIRNLSFSIDHIVSIGTGIEVKSFVSLHPFKYATKSIT